MKLKAYPSKRLWDNTASPTLVPLLCLSCLGIGQMQVMLLVRNTSIRVQNILKFLSVPLKLPLGAVEAGQAAMFLFSPAYFLVHVGVRHFREIWCKPRLGQRIPTDIFWVPRRLHLVSFCFMNSGK